MDSHSLLSLGLILRAEPLHVQTSMVLQLAETNITLPVTKKRKVYLPRIVNSCCPALALSLDRQVSLDPAATLGMAGPLRNCCTICSDILPCQYLYCHTCLKTLGPQSHSSPHNKPMRARHRRSQESKAICVSHSLLSSLCLPHPLLFSLPWGICDLRGWPYQTAPSHSIVCWVLYVLRERVAPGSLEDVRVGL